MTMRFPRVLGTAMALGLAFWTVQAQAAIELLGSYAKNECKDATGFSNCYAFPDGTTGAWRDDLAGSPAIFKYGVNDAGGVETDKSTLFPTIDGSEFTVNYLSGDNSLSFAYDQGSGDPVIHYFAIFQAGTTRLFHDSDPITSGNIALSDYYPRNPGYSHITFFDTGTPAVPEPATWAMMLLGFGFVGGAMRSAKRRQRLAVSAA